MKFKEVAKANTSKSSKFHFQHFLSQHKVLTAATILLALLISVIVASISVQGSYKFSRENFDRLTATAATIINQASGEDPIISRTCSYERPGEFDNLHLYCRVSMVAYLPYKDDSNAIKIAKKLDNILRLTFKQSYLHFSSFFQKPYNGYGVTVILLNEPAGHQCNFYVETNKNAERVLNFPAKSDDDLIALSFECSAESQAEYFPVTYRQG